MPEPTEASGPTHCNQTTDGIDQTFDEPLFIDAGMSELTPKQRETMMRRLEEIAVELDVIARAADVAGIAIPPRYEQLHRERCELEIKLWNRIDVTGSEQENDRSHLACPKCNSTDLDFKGLRNNMRAEGEEGGAEPDVEVVSATYSWKCKKCKHDFEVTIRN